MVGFHFPSHEINTSKNNSSTFSIQGVNSINLQPLFLFPNFTTNKEITKNEGFFVADEVKRNKEGEY